MMPLVACLLLSVASPTSPSPAAPGRVAEGRGRFSIELPAGWEPVEDVVFARLGGLSLRQTGPAPAATLKAVAVEFPLKIDLEEYVANSTLAYKAIWKIEERSTPQLAGARAVRLVIVQEIGPDVKRLLKYFVATEKGAVVLTLAVTPEAFAQRLPDFEAIARSLQLAPQAP